MVGKILRWIGAILVILAAVSATLYARRTNPIQFVSGRQLTGEVVCAPVAAWSYPMDVRPVAIEPRPGAPYSVTTWCFVLEGKLYIPASAGSTKTWTHFAAAAPHVRVKIDGKIYPGIATRVTDPALREPIREVVLAKYPEAARMSSGGEPSDVWLFRVDSPQPSGAVEPPDVATGNP